MIKRFQKFEYKIITATTNKDFNVELNSEALDGYVIDKFAQSVSSDSDGRPQSYLFTAVMKREAEVKKVKIKVYPSSS